MEINDHVNGIFAIIWVAIAVIVGVTFILRARKYKQNILIYWGIGFTGITCPWYPTIVSYFVAFFNETGLALEQYLSFGFPFIAVTFIFTAYVIMELIAKKKGKLIVVIIVTVISVLFLIYYYYTLFLGDASKLAEKGDSPVDISYTGLAIFFALYIAGAFATLGILLSVNLIKSDNPENKLKGKFLLFAFIVYTIGALLDAFAITWYFVIFTRTLLISSAIGMYIGWLMPESIKKLFLKA
ncbi:MAG: hypothetical protein ACFFBP_00195 [Promethearchaeota archaeon]